MGKLLQMLGSVVGLLIKVLKVLIVISLLQGIFTGNWRNLIACGILVLFLLLTSRYASNMIAWLSTFIPFSSELFGVDPSLREKGEQIRENGNDMFKRY